MWTDGSSKHIWRFHSAAKVGFSQPLCGWRFLPTGYVRTCVALQICSDMLQNVLSPDCKLHKQTQRIC